MMILVANQIWWTAEVENVFDKISQGNKRAMKEAMHTNCECNYICNNVSCSKKNIYISYVYSIYNNSTLNWTKW